MTTRERIRLLAEAVRASDTQAYLPDLREWEEALALELGHPEILDGFRPFGSGYSQAKAMSPLLHIVSGNTPHAALQSTVRGLILGAMNWVKLPSAGLPIFDRFLAALPRALAEKVECASTLPAHWLKQARAVLVFGNDKTVSAIHSQTRPDQVFIAHGNKVSFGIIFDDPGWQSVPGAARDISLFDQMGCLSPHLFYIADAISIHEYARRLADKMEACEKSQPRAPIAPEHAAHIQAVRAEWRFRALTDSGIAVHASEGSTAWTVIVDTTSEFTLSPLNRVVFLKPLPSELPIALAGVSPWLSTVGIFPCTPESTAQVSQTGVSRICRVGSMQYPSGFWHQDAGAQFAPLVVWIDFEP